VVLAVGGMSCAACAARVERVLNGIGGVSASVNYATEIATVQADPTIDVARLVAEVQRSGYTAQVLPGEAVAVPGSEAARGHAAYIWRRLVVALLVGVPLGDIAIALALVPSLRFPGWRWVLLLMAVPVVAWCAWPFHRKAFLGARRGSASMDTLVSVGIIAASGWSIYTMFGHHEMDRAGQSLWELVSRPSGSVYLDVAAGVTIFVLAGRMFEARAKHTAGGALRALAELGAREVIVLADGDQEVTVAVAELRVGDRFLVRPGQTVATDGTVETGECALDTSTVTGESMPVEVTVGDAVIGGTVALAGRAVVRAVRVGSDTQLAQLVALVNRAQSEKAGVQRIADRIAGVFVPAVLAIAAATFAGWMLVHGGIAHAVAAALAVLIIACPCALGLATPTALLVASGRGAQLGVFIKGHQALESARAIDTVVLDKTGTLTSGQMSVVEVWVAPEVGAEDLARWAGAVEHASEHVAARAISQFVRVELCTELPAVTAFTSHPGLGAQGMVDGHRVAVGSARMLRQAGATLPAEPADTWAKWERMGRTTVGVTCDGTVIGLFALADTVRPSAAEAIAQLHRLGLRTVLLTGDNRVTARTVAGQVGIEDVVAEVLPADKATAITDLRSQGRRVAMVGDGVNDAPALAAATLGLALHTGTDIAIGAADMILMRTDLRVIAVAVGLARATLRTIRGNLLWAFGYNLAALPLAALGLLNPLIAAAAMALSSLFVVSHSLRLQRFGERVAATAPTVSTTSS
jgi:heavy metal translocating P-type ATPase